MNIKISKVARGIAPGDVSNIAIRNILTELSVIMHGKFLDSDMETTMEYFDYHCPYTGKDLRGMFQSGDYSQIVTDHIVPQNKKHCGLNVIGNLVYVDRQANNEKKDQTVEDFLLHNQGVLKGVSLKERQARLEKIRQFQKDMGYDPASIQAEISPILTVFYDKIATILDDMTSDIATRLGLSKSLAIRKQHSRIGSTELVFQPDEKTVKEYLLTHQCAVFDLEYLDPNHNRHFTWTATRFSAKSNLRGNIASRPWWRDKESSGLVKVTVSVPSSD